MLLQMVGFPLSPGWIIIHCRYIPHLFYPVICWWTLRLFPCLSYCEQCYSGHGCGDISLRSCFYFLWINTHNGISRSYRRSVFKFSRNLHTVCHSGCTNLHSHQQCTRVPFSPHPHQHLLPFVYLIMAILTGVRWSPLYVVVIGIFPMTGDGEHLLLCLSALCTSLEKCLFSSSARFRIAVLVFCRWVVQDDFLMAS